MPFKLVLKSAPSQASLPPTEQELDGAIVTIGRGETSDVHLPDSRRLVSSKHAEIQQQQDQYRLVDVGSKNGTTLNGQRVEVGKEYPLSQHDEIGVGEFVLEFLPLLPRQDSTGPIVDSDETICLVPSSSSSPFDVVVNRLRRTYREAMSLDSQGRVEQLANILRDAIKELDAGDVDRLLSLVEVTFPDSQFHQEELANGSAHGKLDVRASESPVPQSAVPGASGVVSRYLSGASTSSSSESMNLASERVEQVMTALLNYLADAIKGRREFEKELEVEVTRILSRERSPIKWASSSQDIGEYLFDLQKDKTKSDEVVRDLHRALEDLALHPIGLIAGFRECLRSLLNQLDPSTLSAEAKASSSKLGPLAVGPILKVAAWERFTQKHRTLVEEEVKTFQHLLGPEFAKGYLRVYQQTKPSKN